LLAVALLLAPALYWILHRRFSISAQEDILLNVDRAADRNIWRCGIDLHGAV
jgi:hypothetical protein